MSRLRWGAVADALASLVGTIGVPVTAPTVRGERYRAAPARGIAPLVDLWAAAGPAPGVLLIHGGGFVGGARDMKPMRIVATRLAAAGLFVASMDYRLIFRGGRLAEAVDDVHAAIAHLGRRGPALGLDPARLSLVGLSAGGALAMLAGVDPAVARVVSCFGLYEVDHLEGPLAGLLPRLLFSSDDPAAWHARSPRGAPQPRVPTLILHGDDDGLVPVAQAERLAAHRASLGLPTRLVVYPGAPHAFFNRPCAAAEAAFGEIVRHVSAVSGTGS